MREGKKFHILEKLLCHRYFKKKFTNTGAEIDNKGSEENSFFSNF